MKRQFIWDVAFCSQKAQTKQFSSCVEGVGRGVRGWVGSHCKEQIPPIKCKMHTQQFARFYWSCNFLTGPHQQVREYQNVCLEFSVFCLFVCFPRPEVAVAAQSPNLFSTLSRDVVIWSQLSLNNFLSLERHASTIKIASWLLPMHSKCCRNAVDRTQCIESRYEYFF